MKATKLHKKIVATLLILLLFIVCNIHAQTSALETALERINVSLNLPEFLTASQNEELIYATPVTKESPSPSIAQRYGHEPTSNLTAYKVMFTLIHSIIRHKEGDYVMFVYVAGEINFVFDIKESKDRAHNINPFGRIKNDMNYGKKNWSPTPEEVAALDTMITHYPKERAQELFNADYMVSYPKELYGKVYEDKYSHCRAVKVAKDGQDIYFYFMTTEDITEKINKYLSDLKGVFWYNE